MINSSQNKQLSNSILATLLCLAPMSSFGYSEDLRADAYDASVSDSHSTLHFEMVQTLAAAAGFTELKELPSMYDATRIAQASSGADTFPTEELGELTCAVLTNEVETRNSSELLVNTTDNIYIGGTLRTKDQKSDSFNQTAFFHWPRRYAFSPVLNTSYVSTDEIDANTCDYFNNITDTTDSRYCGENTESIDLRAEINILESWVYKSGDSNNNNIIDILEVEIKTDTNPIVDIPCYAEPGGTFQTIKGGSLISLGIYLHSLADSYSHQSCMQLNQTRNHDEVEGESRFNQAIECDALDWHIDEEFGSDSGDKDVFDLGVAYTRVSSLAIWQALNTYNATYTYHNNKIASVSDIKNFINDFSEEDNPEKRSCIASTYYKQIINTGDTSYSNLTSAECDNIR